MSNKTISENMIADRSLHVAIEHLLLLPRPFQLLSVANVSFASSPDNYLSSGD